MKGNNSNLEGLGIGNFNVFSIHLHSTWPKVNELLESDEDVVEVGGETTIEREKMLLLIY